MCLGVFGFGFGGKFPSVRMRSIRGLRRYAPRAFPLMGVRPESARDFAHRQPAFVEPASSALRRTIDQLARVAEVTGRNGQWTERRHDHDLRRAAVALDVHQQLTV